MIFVNLLLFVSNVSCNQLEFAVICLFLHSSYPCVTAMLLAIV